MYLIPGMALSASLQEELQAACGAHDIRIVWTREADTGSTAPFFGDNLLMAYDGKTDTFRELSTRPLRMGFRFPRFTADGNTVVYSNNDGVYALDWVTAKSRKLRWAMPPIGIWRDPTTGIDWVYFRTTTANGKALQRFDLRSPADAPELVWDKVVHGDSADIGYFSFAADGDYIAGAFPWPSMGIAQLPNGQYHEICNPCCQANIAPDTSHVVVHYLGDHRFLYFKAGVIAGAAQEVGRPDLSAALANKYGGSRLDYRERTLRWTNHPRIILSTGPLNQTDADGFRIYDRLCLLRISDDFDSVTEVIRITEVGHPGGDDGQPDAWIEPTVTHGLAPGYLHFRADSGAASPEPQHVELRLAQAHPSPVVSVACTSSWLDVTVDSSQTPLSVVGRLLTTSLPSGVHSCEVSIAVAGAVHYLMAYVTVNAAPVLTSLAVIPDTANIAPDESTQFTMRAQDQFGDPFPVTPRWAIDDGGTINSSGLFRSDGAPGCYQVTGVVGECASCTAHAFVTVETGLPLGAEPVQRMLRLVDFRGTAKLPLVDTTAVQQAYTGASATSPLPGERITANSKELLWVDSYAGQDTLWYDALPDTPSVCFWSLVVYSAAERDVSFSCRHSGALRIWKNGAPVDGFAGADGGLQSRTREVTLMPGPNALLFRLLQPEDASVFSLSILDSEGLHVDGLHYPDLTEPNASILHVIAPNGGDSLTVGDTVLVRWTAIPNRVDGVVLEVSPDAGESWGEIAPRAIYFSDSAWGRYPWIVPSSLGELSLLSARCLMQARGYNNPCADITDDFFEISPPSQVGLRTHETCCRKLAVRAAAEGIRVSLPAGVHTIDVYSVHGRRLHKAVRTGPSTALISRNGLGSGTLVVTVVSGSTRSVKRRLAVW